MTGVFVVSLDFELYWGVRDHCSLDTIAGDLIATRSIIPRILSLFAGYQVRATWATVGFLFFDKRSKLLEALPRLKPRYRQSNYSPYEEIAALGLDEVEDPYRFGLSLIEEIDRCPGQEIGTHTFSHYFALEDGQTLETFRDDIEAACATARHTARHVRSLVFPRNQCNDAYLAACRQIGVETYRGNPTSWIYRPRPRSTENKWLRAIRLVDAYVNLSGYHTYVLPKPYSTELPLNVPASRFLRPWSLRLRYLEGLRLRRIKRAMTHAARRGEVFHLWWHPENFGQHHSENLLFLEEILRHYCRLHHKYGMISANMGDFADLSA